MPALMSVGQTETVSRHFSMDAENKPALLLAAIHFCRHFWPAPISAGTTDEKPGLLPARVLGDACHLLRKGLIADSTLDKE